MRLRITSIIVFVCSIFAVPASAGATSHAHLPYPMNRIQPSIARTFSCIIFHESTSTWKHPNLRDNNPYGSSGVFQIEPVLWDRWASRVGVHVPVWRASFRQQMLVAIEIYRYDGWSPWRADSMCF